jgi:uncharacterized protein (DUF1778 family)
MCKGLGMASETGKKPTNKVGRPKAAEETTRVSPRLPTSVVERMKRAAALRGVESRTFIIEALERLSKEVIEEEQVWQLRDAQAKKVAGLLAKPPKPSKFAEESAKLAAKHVEIRS